MNAVGLLSGYFGFNAADFLKEKNMHWVKLSTVLKNTRLTLGDLLTNHYAEMFWQYKRHQTVKFLKHTSGGNVILHDSVRDILSFDKLGKYLGKANESDLKQLYIPASWARSILVNRKPNSLISAKIDLALESAACVGRSSLTVPTELVPGLLYTLRKRFNATAEAAKATYTHLKYKPYFEVYQLENGAFTRLIISDVHRFKTTIASITSSNLSANGFKLYAVGKKQNQLEAAYMRAA